MQPRLQWQIGSPSYPSVPGLQTQEPPIPTIRYGLPTDTSVPAPNPASAVSPPKSEMLQERRERQTGGGHTSSSLCCAGGYDGLHFCLPFHPSQDTENHSSLGAGAGYSRTAVNVNNIRRDDSFNIFGTGNSVYFSLAR